MKSKRSSKCLVLIYFELQANCLLRLLVHLSPGVGPHVAAVLAGAERNTELLDLATATRAWAARRKIGTMASCMIPPKRPELSGVTHS